MDLDQGEEFQKCFISYDTKLTGNISKHEIDDLYRDMGMSVDKDDIGKILNYCEKAKNPSYPDFVTVLHCFCYMNKAKADAEADEKLADFINSFVSMGGNQDKTGVVMKKTLIEFLIMFELTLDLEELMRKSGLNEE